MSPSTPITRPVAAAWPTRRGDLDPATLANTHRDLQRQHHAALAEENAAALALVQRRLAALEDHLRAHDYADLARALAAETRAGAALLVALTSPGPPDELATTLTAYQHRTLETGRHLPA